jgi:hypothetical protein
MLEGSHRVLVLSTLYSFYLLFVVCIYIDIYIREAFGAYLQDCCHIGFRAWIVSKSEWPVGTTWFTRLFQAKDCSANPSYGLFLHTCACFVLTERTY